MSFVIGPATPSTPTFKRPANSAAIGTTDYSTLFEQLLPAAWRGICFPVTSIRTVIDQDLAVHKYWGVDGARVESTGRAPRTFEATIPLVNGIVPGKNETWGSGSSTSNSNNGVLYPGVFLDLVDSFLDSSSGIFQHPQHGGVACKPAGLEYTHDAETQDGVIVTARWIETNDPDLDVAQQTKSPIQEARVAALDLDSSTTDILALLPPGQSQLETFDSLVGKLTGVIDSTALGINQLKALPNQIVNRIDTLVDSCQRLKNVFTWPTIEAAGRLRSSVQNLITPGAGVTRIAFVNGRPVPVAVDSPTKATGRYTTTATSSLGQVAGYLAKMGHTNSTDDLIELNPFLLSDPQVGQGATVVYYV